MEIDLFSNNKNMVYSATPSEYNRVTNWRLIIEKTCDIVYDTLRRIPTETNDQAETSTCASLNCDLF